VRALRETVDRIAVGERPINEVADFFHGAPLVLRI
jgi:hypothetical protein